MIYFEAPYLMVNGLTILKDHADPYQFYYYPAQPRLALNPDGSPTFLFIKYRQDATTLPPGSEPGGGFLIFDVDLRVDQGDVDAAARYIKESLKLDRDPLLAPIEYRTGKTKLIFLDYQPPAEDTAVPDGGGAGSGAGAATTTPAGGAAAVGGPPSAATLHFVEHASYNATPSLYGDERATFSVQLSAEGATLVEDTLDAKTSLIGVVYDLTFVGLRPAYNVVLTVDWNRVSTYLENDFKVNVLFFDADISDAVNKLIEDRVIQLDVISFGAGTADADIIAEKDDAVQFVKQFITEKFFEPSLAPKEAFPDSSYYEAAQAIQQLNPTFCGYTRKSISDVDQKSLSLTMREESGIERRIVPQGHLQGMMDELQQSPRDAYVREIDLADPFFKMVHVDVIGGASITPDHVDYVQVHFEYGPAGATQPADVLLHASGDKGEVQWALDPTLGLTYSYSYEVIFKPDAPVGVGDHLQSPTIQTNATKLVIDPRDLYQIRPVKALAFNLPFDRYPEVEVDLRYTDPASNVTLSNTSLLAQSNPVADWTYRMNDPLQTTYQYKLTYAVSGADSVTLDFQDTIDPAVLVRDPRPPAFSVMVAPAGDYTKILRIIVEMSYDDTANNVHENDVLTFKDAMSIQQWTPHTQDPSKRQYTYHVIVQYKDGTVRDEPLVASTDAFITVGDVFRRTAHVTVSASGQPFSVVGLAKVRVGLSYDDNANQIHTSTECILTTLADTFNWSYQIVDPTLQSYTYDVTYFSTTGFQRNVPAQPSTAEQLVIPIN
jgi:hypothetical protein